MSAHNDPALGEKLVVRRGRVDSVDLFEIKENELDLLEQGSPATLQLNFAIFLLSIAFSAIVTLTTGDLPTGTVKTVYVIVSVIGILFGAYLLIMWWKTKCSIDEIVLKIRKRIPADVISAASSSAGPARGAPLWAPACRGIWHAVPCRGA